MSAETVCTLSIDHAIRIAKIIATAPVERLPMITQLFHHASVDLEGLDELIENSSLTTQSQLVDTDEFIREVTKGRELTDKGYLFTSDEFNRLCLERNLQPRLVKQGYGSFPRGAQPWLQRHIGCGCTTYWSLPDLGQWW